MAPIPLILRLLLAAGSVWGALKVRDHVRRNGGLHLRLPEFSAGASAQVNSATASWHFRLGKVKEEAQTTDIEAQPVVEPARLATALPAPVPGGSGDDFFVFNDENHSRARIHRADCRYCKGTELLLDGRPAQGADPVEAERWQGPFASADQAAAIADGLRRADTRFCRICCADLADAAGA